MLVALHRIALSLALLALPGCAREHRVAPHETEAFPLRVVGVVEELRSDALHVELESGDAWPSGIALIVQLPPSRAGSVLWLYYYDAPMIQGRVVRIGDTIRFTAPTEKHLQLPFLADFPEATLMSRDSGG